MRFLKRTAALALLSCLIAIMGKAQSSDGHSEPLFFINKRPVSSAEFIYLYRKNHQHKPEEFTKEKIDAYLDLFINYKLKVEEAMSRGMDTTAKFRREYQTYRDELLKPYMPDSKVIDSLVKLTYDRLTEEVNASHILIQVSPDATPADTLRAYKRIIEARERAVAGEDFGALAAELSEEPRASETKGNLGFFTAMQMVFPFEQAAYMTPVGKVSQPVRTRFGYHIVKVLDRQPSRGEVEVSHIMIRTPQGIDDANARNKIFDIYDKLQKGMDWEELCREHSEDPNSKDNGGKLRPFGVGGMSSAPEFQEMAFSLREPGDISDPVRTQFGWHIIRLESKIPLPPFEEMKPSLTQRVSRDERTKVSKAALRARMRKEFGFSENAAVKSRLSSFADSLIEGRTGVLKSMQDQALFTMNDQRYQVADFLSYVQDQQISSSGTSAQAFEELYMRYVDYVQLRVLEDRVKRESPDYRWLLKEYYEGILLFEIMEQEVWNKAMDDSIGQRDYFEKHPGKYLAGERMAGKIYTTQMDGVLDKLREKIQGDETDLELFVRNNHIRVDSGAFERSDRTIFSKIGWSPGLYEVTLNGVHYLVQVEKILPPGAETFDEARASVISDYQTFLEDSWISELKRKFGVKVDKKVKKKVFAELIDQTNKLP
ncbi:MAG TPA: peptidylprolyl isomerase [Chryseosolibacter sp.]|nr:peptidylprolyl isomerase [Chryseosolibacter sp.]